MVERPTMDLLRLQNVTSFLKARKSKRRWTAETVKVSSSRNRLVSTKIPFTSSVSFKVKPSD